MVMQKAVSERCIQNSIAKRIAARTSYKLILWNAEWVHHM